MPIPGVGCRRRPWAPTQAEASVTPDETKLAELLERLEATLQEVREHLERGRSQAAAAPAKEIEAFADEAFRDRDA